MKVHTMKNNGIVYTEEVPTNSASSGAIAGLPPDEPPVFKKKKKKFKIDFVQRIKNSRLKEETMEDQTNILEARFLKTQLLSLTIFKFLMKRELIPRFKSR